MSKDWRAVKKDIDSELEKIRIEAPAEVRRMMQGIIDSEAGSYGQYFSTIVFVSGEVRALGIYSARFLLHAVDIPGIALDQLKALARLCLPVGAEFLGYCGLTTLMSLTMIAGFVIMIDRPFRIGDRIKLPSGEIGDVYEIGLRSTKILDFDNNLIVSPNAELTKTRVINYSYPRNDIRVLVEVNVAYGTSIERAREIMLNLAHQNSDLLKQPEPNIFFSAMGETSCTLQLMGRTDDWKKKGRAENVLREQIYTAFMKEGISSGMAKHVVQLSSPNTHASPKND